MKKKQHKDLANEIRYAIKNLKSGKTTGPGEVPADSLELLDDTNTLILLNLYNSTYNSGILPQE